MKLNEILKDYDADLRAIRAETWCKLKNIESYTIRKDGTIDVDGSVTLTTSKDDGIDLPYKFGNIRNNFTISPIGQDTLKNFPDNIGGELYVAGHKLKSLEGGPIRAKVYGIHNARLNNLDHLPKYATTLKIFSPNGLEPYEYRKVLYIQGLRGFSSSLKKVSDLINPVLGDKSMIAATITKLKNMWI